MKLPHLSHQPGVIAIQPQIGVGCLPQNGAELFLEPKIGVGRLAQIQVEDLVQIRFNHLQQTTLKLQLAPEACQRFNR